MHHSVTLAFPVLTLAFPLPMHLYHFPSPKLRRVKGMANYSAGFYAENLLLYEPQAKSGELPLPAGKKGKFAPVALGDIALLAATILTGHGEHGLDDRHRGQLIICTGPEMMAGEELAEAASQALGSKMTYKAISEYSP